MEHEGCRMALVIDELIEKHPDQLPQGVDLETHQPSCTMMFQLEGGAQGAGPVRKHPELPGVYIATIGLGDKTGIKAMAEVTFEALRVVSVMRQIGKPEESRIVPASGLPAGVAIRR